MLKLYYSPGACSLSPHIALREAGLSFELERVNTQTKKTASDGDFLEISPNGYVPVLGLNDGQKLTEGPAIVQYIADQNPQAQLAPANGTPQRYRLQEWLNFISTEVHKGYSPLFNPATPEEYKKAVITRLLSRYAYLNKALVGKQYLMGDQFTVADGYLFTVTNWSNFLKIDLSAYPNVVAFQARVAARPKVQEALKAEGLLK
jgi:glutathione S-transferase